MNLYQRLKLKVTTVLHKIFPHHFGTHIPGLHKVTDRIDYIVTETESTCLICGAKNYEFYGSYTEWLVELNIIQRLRFNQGSKELQDLRDLQLGNRHFQPHAPQFQGSILDLTEDDLPF